MDASNPVSSGDKVTFADLKEDSLLLKRQNFEELKKLIGTSPRTPAPYIGRNEYDFDDDVVKDLIKPIAVAKGNPEVDFLTQAAKVRVCSRHTMGENQEEGNVSMKQTYKIAKRDRKLVEVCLKSGAKSEDIQRLIYTTGNKEGFSKRLRLWATKKVPSPKTAMEKYNIKFEDVRAALPVEMGLPNWNGNIEEFISRVRVNKSSGAGPPFYRTKRQCLDECFDVIAELIKEANQDHLEKFLRENEEFLVCQCKNKTDRYPPEKLSEKTRPYFSFSFPTQFLCSALNQPFTDNMHLFHEKGSNACGFSYAGGGSQKLFDWMRATEEGETKFCAYGDDIRMVKREDGVLYSCSPDFQCMDGSIHKTEAAEYVDYVLHCYEREHGPNNFWKFVGEVWKKQLVGAKFFVNGSQPYRSETGLLTGCVGTTGVDTFKSVTAFVTLIEASKHYGVDIMNVEEVKTFMRDNFGLVLKGDTYSWEEVQEELEEGEQPNSQEFLGVQLRAVLGKNRLEVIPYKEESDIVSLISNARVPEEVRDMKKTTGRSRYLFDCARGYMITAAFLHEKTWNICSRLIEETSTEVICMRVQTGKKVDGEYGGEGPELVDLVGEDFTWPSSDGWPSVDFCVDVYLSDGNKRGGLWYDCIPALKERLNEIKKYRSMRDPHHVPVVVSKAVQTSSWAEETEVERGRENAELAMERKRDPTVDSEGYLRPFLREKTPLMKPAKYPKEFVKYKATEQSVPKEKRIANAIPGGAEKFHRDFIPLVTNLAPGKCAEVLISLGWRPSPEESYWEKGPIVPVRDSDWTRAELDRLQGVPRREIKPVISADRGGKTWCDVPIDVKLSDREVDVVSRVSYSFTNAGYILDRKYTVLENSPNPWGVLRVVYRGTGVLVGEGFGANKSEATSAVFELMMERIKAKEPGPLTSEIVKTENGENRATESETARAEEEAKTECEIEERIESGSTQTVASASEGKDGGN